MEGYQNIQGLDNLLCDERLSEFDLTIMEEQPINLGLSYSLDR